MAVFLTLSLITLIQDPGSSVIAMVPSFLLQMGLGGLLGYVLGRLATVALNRANLDYEGLYPVLSLTLMVLVFAFSSYVGGNGFLAIYVAGITMGNSVFIHKRSLLRFHDGLAWLGQITMFLTLGLLVFPSQIVPVIGTGVLVALFLMFVARPISVHLLLAFSRFGWRSRTLVGWVGLRGAVPIILATFPLVAGLPGSSVIFNMVFFIVLTSALVQGTTIPLVAKWLGVEGPAYRSEPVSSAEPMERQLTEYLVPEDSRLVGRQIARAGLPDGAHALLIERYATFIVPSGARGSAATTSCWCLPMTMPCGPCTIART
jgi:cell volume regulation protein A